MLSSKNELQESFTARGSHIWRLSLVAITLLGIISLFGCREITSSPTEIQASVDDSALVGQDGFWMPNGNQHKENCGCNTCDAIRANLEAFCSSDTVVVIDTLNTNDTCSATDTVVVTDTVIVADSATTVDTIVVTDTLVAVDTVLYVDTVVVMDTVIVTDLSTTVDTIVVTDTVVTVDTVSIIDTVFVDDSITVFDTVTVSSVDTIVVTDTVIVNQNVTVVDTVTIIDTVGTIAALDGEWLRFSAYEATKSFIKNKYPASADDRFSSNSTFCNYNANTPAGQAGFSFIDNGDGTYTTAGYTYEYLFGTVGFVWGAAQSQPTENTYHYTCIMQLGGDDGWTLLNVNLQQAGAYIRDTRHD